MSPRNQFKLLAGFTSRRATRVVPRGHLDSSKELPPRPVQCLSWTTAGEAATPEPLIEEEMTLPAEGGLTFPIEEEMAPPIGEVTAALNRPITGEEGIEEVGGMTTPERTSKAHRRRLSIGGEVLPIWVMTETTTMAEGVTRTETMMAVAGEAPISELEITSQGALFLPRRLAAPFPPLRHVAPFPTLHEGASFLRARPRSTLLIRIRPRGALFIRPRRRGAPLPPSPPSPRRLQQPSKPSFVESGRYSDAVPEMEPSKLLDGFPPPYSPKCMEKALPIRRPDKGGTNAIRTTTVHVNHFPVKFNSETIILQYDIDIQPEELPKRARDPKISKSTICMIKDKLFSDDPTRSPLSRTAFDGQKNIFSAVELPTGKFKVEFSESEDMRICSYIFTIKLVKQLELCKLKDYLSGKLLSLTREILHGMDVVMKENPARHMIPLGRSFYPFHFSRDDDLGQGIVASTGFLHSLKPTAQGLTLCLDTSVLALRKPIPVIEFLEEHVSGFKLNDLRRVRREVEVALKGLKVRVIHRLCKQKYTISGLSGENTRNISFTAEDPEGKSAAKKIQLIDYFTEKYGKYIKYKDIPCLDVGKNNRKNYVPMEFCILTEGQRFLKENLDRNGAQKLKNMSLVPPRVRQNNICEMVKSRSGPCRGDVVRNFGIEVNMAVTTVVAHVIMAPELKLGGAHNSRMNKITVDRNKCHWNFVGKSVVEGKYIDRWAVLDFSSYEGFNKLNPDQFIPKFIKRCASLGIRVREPLLYQSAGMNTFSNVAKLGELLLGVADRVYERERNPLQILLCVMARRDPGYNYLKWFCETKIGIVTQCCLSNLANKANDQYLANLALKMNAKLGGSNVELSDQLPRFENEGHVMFIGADVNHPGAWNSASPSIAAVVGSVNWPAVNHYAARVCPQSHRTEKILNFGDMCLELIDTYARVNRAKPDKIVVFRDGVSDGQFDMVLNEELIDIKMAIQRGNYNPTITLIVTQKRHQTRLFPEYKRERGLQDRSSNENVSPGTVVDTIVVHPFEFDFYLCSHYGGIGTSKPTHYHVLYDEHRFSSDQLQKLVYNLCFTFVRCTKPVSLVPPVYYADLVAYRGRLYHDAVELERPTASTSSTSSSLHSSAGATYDERFYCLHRDLENMMFFV